MMKATIRVRSIARSVTPALAFLAVACGGSYAETSAGGMPGNAAYEESATAEPAPATDRGSGGEAFDFADINVRGDLAAPQGAPTQIAQAPAAPPRDGTPDKASPNTDTSEAGQTTATDAVDPARPLIMYTATFVLGVYEVEKTQKRLISAAEELGGYVSEHSDQRIVLRVPAKRFYDAVDGVEEAGDVLQRNVQALDVTEEFRDIVLRLRNAEKMRDRLEALLGRAENVDAALRIEQELQRLTEYIEQLKGKQRYLADRLTFSTLTIDFRSLSTEAEGRDGFELPFPWLRELGLTTLMSL